MIDRVHLSSASRSRISKQFFPLPVPLVVLLCRCSVDGILVGHCRDL